MIKNSYYRAIMKASCDDILPEMGDYWRNHIDISHNSYTEMHIQSDLIDFLTMRSIIRNKHD